METTEQNAVQFARAWRTSTKVYKGNGVWEDNPDYHPEIRQGTDGKFYDGVGKPLAKKDVPDYILEQVKDRPPNKINVAAFQTSRSRDMAEAMVDAGVAKPTRVLQTTE